MPTVFSFNGAVFGWGETDADSVSAASGTFKWAPGLPSGAQKGTGRVLAGQSAVLAFPPLKDGYPNPETARLGLWAGDAGQVELTTEDDPTQFRVLADGTVLVAIDDSQLAGLSAGRYDLELWDLDADAPIATGRLTVADSVRPE
jgi:hypothetical protein